LQARGLHILLGNRNKRNGEPEKHVQLPPQIGREKATAAAWKQRLYNCTNGESSRQTVGLTAWRGTAHVLITRHENCRGNKAREPKFVSLSFTIHLELIKKKCHI